MFLGGASYVFRRGCRAIFGTVRHFDDMRNMGTLKAFTYSSKPSVAVIETCTKSQDINFGESLPNVLTSKDCLLTVSRLNEFLSRLDIYDFWLQESKTILDFTFCCCGELGFPTIALAVCKSTEALPFAQTLADVCFSC